MTTETVDLSKTPASKFLDTPEGRAILRRNLDRYCGEPTRASGGKTDYVIRCVLPDHVDENPSMVVTFEDEGAQVFCRSHPGGWGQDELLEATKLIAQEEFQTWAEPAEQVEGPETGRPLEDEPTMAVIEVKSSSSWFEEYTGIAWERWQELGTVAREDGVGFTSNQSPLVLVKKIDGGRYREPRNIKGPHLWPDLAAELPLLLWLTEGETDCGVLRELGLDAYSSGSAGNTIPKAVWEECASRGVQIIYIVPDIDDVGRKHAGVLKSHISEAGITPIVVDLGPVLNASAGEKDLRDLWLREGERTKELVYECLASALQPKDPFAISYTAYREKYEISPVEVIPGWLYQGMIQLLVGEPGVFKSWLALDEALSYATGKPFLGKVQPKMTGNQLVLVMEDAHSMINDRIPLLLGASIRTHEGVTSEGNPSRIIEIQFPDTPENLGKKLFLHDRRDFDVTSDASWDEAERFIRDNDIKHLYADPLFATTGRDASADYFTQAAMMIATRGKAMRDRTGCGMTFVHHTSHAGNAWGSVFLGALREGRIDIKRLSDNEIEVKRFVKSTGYLPRLKITFDVPLPPSEQEYPAIPDTWFACEIEKYDGGADIRSFKRTANERSILSQILDSLATPEWAFWTVEELAGALVDVDYAESTKKDKVRRVLRDLEETDGEERVIKRHRERLPGERSSPAEYGLANRAEG